MTQYHCADCGAPVKEAHTICAKCADDKIAALEGDK